MLHPHQCVLQEVQDSSLQAAVLEACCDCGVWLAWLDAKMPVKQFERYHSSQKRRQEIRRLLNMFDLILPETDVVRLDLCNLTRLPRYVARFTCGTAVLWELCAFSS